MTQEREHLEQTLEGLRDHSEDLAAKISTAGPYISTAGERQRLAEVSAEIRSIEQRLVQIRDNSREAAERHEAEIRLERYRAAIDDAAFWLRRLCTTIGIGNAAAFAAVASGFLQADERRSLAQPVAEALTYFSAGMVWAGAMPIFLFLLALGDQVSLVKAKVDARGHNVLSAALYGLLAAFGIASAYCLFRGFGYAIGGVRGLIPI